MTLALLNNVANYVKVGGIWLTDLINRIGDPYQEFTRPAEEKYPEPLWAKEAKFTNDLDNFLWPERCIYVYTLPANSGDQCLWHGVYSALTAIKYSVTQDQAEVDRLHACVAGLFQHQNVPGELNPRLIRGWRGDGTFEDSVSNDQATGHLLGIYFIWKYGDALSRNHMKDLIAGLADELLINSGKLINADGTPTKHGHLENGLLTDPLNITLLLAIYAVAYRITNEPIYKLRYDQIVKRYFPILPYANVELLWWKKTHHAHRAAIHYSILCDLETDHKIHRQYLRGLLRTWRMERKGANPWIYYLVRRQVLVDPASEEQAKKHLREFTLEDKQHNAERINSTSVETFKWGGHLRCRQPIPRWRAGSQDFFWQRHLYSADDWIGNGAGNLRHNGGDFLIAYWGLRSLRLIGEQE